MSKAKTLASVVSDGAVLADGAVAVAEVSGAVSLTGTETLSGKTISADNNTLSGIAASSFVLSNASGNIDGSAAQKAIPSGTVVGTTDTQTLTNKTISNLVFDGSITEEVVALGTSGSIALEPDDGTIQTCALTGDPTFTDGLSAGQSLVLMLTNGASYTVTWPTITWVTSGGNVAPTLTAADTLVFWKISTTLYGAYVGNYI